MTLRQIAIRIGLDGKAEITNDLKQVGDTGDAAFQQIGTAANDATGKIDRQHQALRNLRDAQARVQAENASGQGSAKDAASAFFPHEMERQAQIAQLKAQQIGQNFQTSLNEAFGIGVAGKSASDSASMFESVANAQRDLEARAAALRAQLDPLGAAQLKLNTAVAGYDTLLGAGKITQDERTAAVALARKEFDATKASLEAMAVGEGVSATKARELLEGFKHLAEGAANGGISVRQLAMGFGDLARAGEGGGITALLANPYVLAGAAIVATLAVVAAAYSRAEAAQQELSLATEFLGRATGATTDELQAMAVASANADNISVAAARDIEVAFAKTGMVGGQSLAGLTALTVKFAHATDESMDDAKGALVKAFADPAHAGEQLLASLDALDDKTRAYMTTAVQSNDIAGAQRVLLEKLRDAVKDGSDQWTWYGNAMEWVVRKGFGVFEWLSHLGSVDLLTNRASLLAQIASVQDSIKNGTTIGGGRVNPQSYLNILQGQLADVNAQIAAAGAKATANASDARATQISTVAGPLIAAATPGYQDHESLQAKLASVNSAGRVNAQGQFVADPAVLAKLSMTAQQAADAQNAYNRAVTTYIDPAAKAQKLNELDIAALNAKTPAQRASIAEQRTALELAGQAVTTGEAQRRIDAAGALARAQAAHAINDESAAYLKLAEAYLKGTAAGVALEDGGKKLGETVGRAAFEGAKQVATLEANVDVQKRLNDAVASGSMTTEQAARAMQLEQALAPLLISQAIAEGKAKDELTRIIARLRQARADDAAEQTRAKGLQIAESGDRNIALLKQELQIANDNDSAREVELSVLQAKQQLLQDNISAESDEGKRIIADATTATELNQQLALAKASRGEIEGLFDSMSNKAAQFLEDGKFSWKSWGDLARSELKDVGAELLKLALINPVKNAFFGGNMPTLDSVGGAIGALLGNKQAANSNALGSLPGIGAPKGTAIDPLYVVPAPTAAGLFGGATGSIESGFGSWLGGGISPIKVTPAMTAASAASDSGWLSGVTDLIASIFHDGGMGDSPSKFRSVPESAFRNAPRFHNGYLGANEVAAIIDKRERVLTPQETRAYNAGAAVGGSRPGGGDIHFHLEGAVVTQELLDQMNAIGRRSERNATSAALKLSRRASAGWQQRDYYEHG